MERIFVQIASYRDPQCGPTIRDLLAKAKRPDRVSFGICLQWQFDNPQDASSCSPNSLPNKTTIRTIEINARQSRGACWARAKCQRLWEGEEFTLQIDSHMRAEPKWDDELINCWTKADNPNAVISCYPNAFTLNDDARTYKPDRSSLPIMGAKEFDSHGILRLHGISKFPLPEHPPTSPPPGAFISAGMLFGPGRIIADTPYDPYLYFYGEETTYAARLWTSGYDIYNPDRLILYHLYKKSTNTTPTHWGDHDNWSDLNATSITRAMELLNGEADIGRHGLGDKRTLAAYQEWSGVDFKNKTIRPHAANGMFDHRPKTERISD